VHGSTVFWMPDDGRMAETSCLNSN
jgi:hypothetical protein